MLADYGGERPPAPDWFEAALAVMPDRSTFDVAGTPIELLTWGEVGRPGLLFLHGNAAHADWWSHIAPAFAESHRCAAISWSGMGRSGWRDSYSITGFADEALAAIDAAQLAASGKPPVFVAHSFGSFPTIYLGARHPERLGGAILVDALSVRVRPPREVSGEPRPLIVYTSEADALARFRFAPPQTENIPTVVDFLARNSLRYDEVSNGWIWRFDPKIWSRYDRSGLDADLLGKMRVPVGLIYGERSTIVTPDRLSQAMSEIADCRFATGVANAGHHIMADQPRALVQAIADGLAKMA